MSAGRDVDDDARAKIQRLLVTGDNRLKQGVDAGEGAGELPAALAAAREAGLEERCGRSSSSGSPISSGSKQKLLHPLRLPPDVVALGGRPRGGVGTR